MRAGRSWMAPRSSKAWSSVAIGICLAIGLAACGGSGGEAAGPAAPIDEQVGLEGDAIAERQARRRTSSATA